MTEIVPKKETSQDKLTFPKCTKVSWCGFKLRGTQDCFFMGACKFKQMRVLND